MSRLPTPPPPRKYNGILTEVEFVPMPPGRLETFARAILPMIEADFADPEFTAGFEDYMRNKEELVHA